MNLLIAKLAGLGILLGSALILGLIPFKLNRILRRHSEVRGAGCVALLLSSIQCFGAGILMATVLTHMLPELRETIQEANPDSDFPLAEVLICCGMFSIYTIEELVELYLRHGGRTQHQHHHDEDPPLVAASASQTSYGTVEKQDAILDHQGHSHLAGRAISGFRVFIVAVALSVHSVFEGAAIGLETTETGVWLLIAAIAAHKSIIAFCLGEQLSASSQPTKTAVITLMVFVLASPIGIVVGTLVSGIGTEAETAGQAQVTNIMQGLAAGSILYVVFFEIIQGEREKPGNGLVKLLAILVGFGLMLLVVSVIHEPEDTATTTTAVVEGNSSNLASL